MKSRDIRFNIYLILFTLWLVGCGTTDAPKKPAGKETDQEAKARAKRENKDATHVTIHLETGAVIPERTLTVPVYRSRPMLVTVEKNPFLHTGVMQQATVTDTPEGHALTIQLNHEGTVLLENISALNRGRRIAIAAQFNETRWIAAPILSRRITDGVIMFLPDATHEETERIARGLNNVIREANK